MSCQYLATTSFNNKKVFTTLILLFIVYLGLVLSPSQGFAKSTILAAKGKCNSDRALSNRFVALTREMSLLTPALYHPAYDDLATSSVGNDLNRFLLELNIDLSKITGSQREEISKIVDHIFGSHRQEQLGSSIALTGLTQLPKLYAHRVYILRHLKDHPASYRCVNSQTVNLVYQAWITRYLNITYTLMSRRLSIFGPIVSQFKKMIANNSLKIVDLSPAKRKKLRNEVPTHHQAKLVHREAKDKGAFLVLGFYWNEGKTVALDFAHPFEDTLIAFSHEVVHATNLEVGVAQKKISSLLPTFIKVIQGWISTDSSDPNAERWARLLINQLAFETGTIDRVTAFSKMLNKRAQVLNAKSYQPPGAQLKAIDVKTKKYLQDIEIVTEMMNLIVTVGLADEYRAYGLSLALYFKLKPLGFKPLSDYQQSLVKLLLKGDAFLASELYFSKDINPFPYIDIQLASDLNQLKKKINPSSNSNTGDEDELIRLRRTYQKFQKILGMLEGRYMTAVAKYVENLPDEIKSLITSPSPNSLDSELYYPEGLNNKGAPANQAGFKAEPNHLLPSYAQPGGFASPTNYLTILMGRVTNAWIVRFELNIKKMHGRLLNANRDLFVLANGILDLSSLSVAELRMIGVLYPDENHAFDFSEDLELANIKSKIKRIRSYGGDYLNKTNLANQHEIPEYITNYFNKVPPWTSTGADTVNGDYGSQYSSDTYLNVVRLQVVKLYHWFDHLFLEYGDTLIGAQSYFDRLLEGNYDHYEISEGQVVAYKKQLADIVRSSHLNVAEVKKLNIIYQSLLTMQTFAKIQGLLPHIEGLNEKIQALRFLMESNGGFQKNERQNPKHSLQDAFKNTRVQIEAASLRCDQAIFQSPNFVQFYSSLEIDLPYWPMQLNVNTVCIQNKLHLIRSPGDSIGNKTISAIKNGSRWVPTIKVFNFGRPIELYPYSPYVLPLNNTP